MKLEDLNSATLQTWRRDALNYLRGYFRDKSPEYEDAVSEAFVKIIQDAQSPAPKLDVSSGTVRRLAFCKTIDSYRRTQVHRKAPHEDWDTPLSIIDLWEQKEDDFETLVQLMDSLSPRHQLLLGLKYKAISRNQLDDMAVKDVHSFISNKYDDSFVAEHYGFKSTQSVRTERHRALSLLKESVHKSQK